MDLAADLGGIFIVLNVTALASAQIINMRETDLIVISSEEATVKPDKAVCLLSVML